MKLPAVGNINYKTVDVVEEHQGVLIEVSLDRSNNPIDELVKHSSIMYLDCEAILLHALSAIILKMAFQLFSLSAEDGLSVSWLTFQKYISLVSGIVRWVM